MQIQCKFNTNTNTNTIQYNYITVRELVGWVRNVVLINVYLDLENPVGSGFWVGGYMSQMREWGS